MFPKQKKNIFFLLLPRKDNCWFQIDQKTTTRLAVIEAVRQDKLDKSGQQILNASGDKQILEKLWIANKMYKYFFQVIK